MPAPPLQSAKIDRRTAILGAISASALRPASTRAAEGGFGFEDVAAMAAARAAERYERREQALAGPFADLDYDRYRKIRGLPEARLWRGAGAGFSIDFTPPGMIYRDRVALHVVSGGTARRIRFRSELFAVSGAEAPLPSPGPEAEAGMDFSGFRILFPLNRPDKEDEIAVFQGASYFRALGRGHVYGLSARGLALGPASEEGEEFPAFTDFWLHEPAPNAADLLVHALLDGPSLAAAFEFRIRPGAETVMETRAAFFPRRRVETAGIAPLTSMYLFGPKDRRGMDDFREAAHDSDGLQMITGAGERLWRPLANPGRLRLSAFADQAPKGFGLVQRARAFADFEDAEARYEKRPSCWVEPVGDWGRGAVNLIEIPTPTELNDNIVAFWRPEAPLEPGERRDFAWRLLWCDTPPDRAGLGRVVATREGRAVNDERLRHVVVDFAFDAPPGEGVEVAAQTDAGAIEHVALFPLPGEARLRVALDFLPPGDGEAELRLALVGPAGDAVSETWLHRWSAP